MRTRLTVDFSIIWFAPEFPILPRVLSLPSTPMKHSWFWATSMWKPLRFEPTKTQRAKVRSTGDPLSAVWTCLLSICPKAFLYSLLPIQQLLCKETGVWRQIWRAREGTKDLAKNREADTDSMRLLLPRSAATPLGCQGISRRRFRVPCTPTRAG
jgi:hypothetical protein